VSDLALRAITAGTRPLPEPGDPPWLPGGAFRHPSAVVTLLWAERYDAAQALADAAVAEAQASANGMILPAVLAQRAWLAFRRGDLTAAEADARALLDAPGSPAPPLLRNRATTVLIDVLVERGNLDEAERILEPLAVDLPGTSQSPAILRHARGRLRFAQRRFGEALGDLRTAGEIATGGLALSPSYLSWRSDAALAALAFGESDTARRLSDEELELARTFGAQRALGVALRAAGLVAGGDRGEALLHEAIEVLAGPDTRLEQARALADLGALLRRSNQRAEARQLLRQAIDTAHHLGAEALALRAETELSASGPGRAVCGLPGSKRSPPASVASPNWPPKGLQTARSPKPCSSQPARSRATSPTCSTSSTSGPGPRCRPLSQRPLAQSAPDPTDGAAQYQGGCAGGSHGVKTDPANTS
jgi:tetratricopeptide (TPR) repeat protein